MCSVPAPFWKKVSGLRHFAGHYCFRMELDLQAVVHHFLAISLAILELADYGIVSGNKQEYKASVLLGEKQISGKTDLVLVNLVSSVWNDEKWIARVLQATDECLAVFELKDFCHWKRESSAVHALVQVALQMVGLRVRVGMVMDFARGYVVERASLVDGKACAVRSERAANPTEVRSSSVGSTD